MGTAEYEPIARRHRVPIVVTGFEPLDLLERILACVHQLEQGRAEVENRYGRAMRPAGNGRAQALLSEVFVIETRAWRGLGEIPRSGLGLGPAYRRFDARRRFHPVARRVASAGPCISGEILRGVRKPADCSAFACACTPEHPLGATIVSSEGACAAYHRYRRPVAATPA